MDKQKYGVYYSVNSYAGFWRRVFAWTIDLMVVALVTGVFAYVGFYLVDLTIEKFAIFFWLSFLGCYVYLGLGKISKFSTLGFHLSNIKIVDLYGKRPSVFKMTVRFLLLAIGPFELITDLIWMSGESTKQTLRDKYVGTYVVKRSAEPIGQGSIIQTRLCVLGWNLVYQEVAIPPNTDTCCANGY